MKRFTIGFCVGVTSWLFFTAIIAVLTSTQTRLMVGTPGTFYARINGIVDVRWFAAVIDLLCILISSYYAGRLFDDPEGWTRWQQNRRRYWGDRDVADSIDLIDNRDQTPK